MEILRNKWVLKYAKRGKCWHLLNILRNWGLKYLILRELKFNLVPLNILNIRGTIGVIWYMESRSKNDKLYVLKS